jgi:hypothetical protein
VNRMKKDGGEDQREDGKRRRTGRRSTRRWKKNQGKPTTRIGFHMPSHHPPSSPIAHPHPHILTIVNFLVMCTSTFHHESQHDVHTHVSSIRVKVGHSGVWMMLDLYDSLFSDSFVVYERWDREEIFSTPVDGSIVTCLFTS